MRWWRCCRATRHDGMPGTKSNRSATKSNRRPSDAHRRLAPVDRRASTDNRHATKSNRRGANDSCSTATVIGCLSTGNARLPLQFFETQSSTTTRERRFDRRRRVFVLRRLMADARRLTIARRHRARTWRRLPFARRRRTTVPPTQEVLRDHIEEIHAETAALATTWRGRRTTTAPATRAAPECRAARGLAR
jgi:hypothetical protein